MICLTKNSSVHKTSAEPYLGFGLARLARALVLTSPSLSSSCVMGMGILALVASAQDPSEPLGRFRLDAQLHVEKLKHQVGKVELYFGTRNN